MWQILRYELSDLSAPAVLCLLASCVLCLRYWQRLDPPLRILAIFLFFNLSIEISSRVLSYWESGNLPLLHLYTPVEFVLFSLFYRKILDPYSIFRRYFVSIVVGTTAAVIANSLYWQTLTHFNNYGKTLVQVLLILYALEYAFGPDMGGERTVVQRKTLSLINTAVLIYYCSSLFVFLFSPLAQKAGDPLTFLWDANALLNLVFQVLIFLGLWKTVFSRNSSS